MVVQKFAFIKIYTYIFLSTIPKSCANLIGKTDSIKEIT